VVGEEPLDEIKLVPYLKDLIQSLPEINQTVLTALCGYLHKVSSYVRAGVCAVCVCVCVLTQFFVEVFECFDNARFVGLVIGQPFASLCSCSTTFSQSIANVFSFRCFCFFFTQVSSNHEANKMITANLAICLAPTLAYSIDHLKTFHAMKPLRYAIPLAFACVVNELGCLCLAV
jgi:hypothetical protein